MRLGDFDESLRVLKGALELKNNVGANTDNDSKKALSLLHYNLGSLQLEYHDKLSVRTGNEVSESIENFARAKELLVAGGYSKDHPDLQEIGKPIYTFVPSFYLHASNYRFACTPPHATHHGDNLVGILNLLPATTYR